MTREICSKRDLYPEITPYNDEMIKVSDIHTVYFEECGNSHGEAVVFLHGGPGGGIGANYRRYFDPKKYRIVLIDQRGCGKSTPFADLRENTTWDLISDIEQIRAHLGIENWAVFGGSWGSTLSLAYAQKHPARVNALFLRGIFMLRKKELRWFYQEGASFIYPDAWEKYIAPIPENERHDYIAAFYKRLTDGNPQVRKEAAKAWSVWEASTSKLYQDQNAMDDFADDDFSQAFARIECHFFTNGGFFEVEEQLLRDIDKIRNIPAIIVQGRYDVVCPAVSAWELHRAWPEAKFVMVQDAGHSVSEPGTISALIESTDSWVNKKTI